MKYIVLIICLCSLFSFTVAAKARPTVITAEIFGYRLTIERDVISVVSDRK